MTQDRLIVDHLALALDGIEPAAAAGVGEALERALRDRLGRLPLEARNWPGLELARVDLGSIEAGGDAAAIAGLIADRLIDWLASRSTARAA